MVAMFDNKHDIYSWYARMKKLTKKKLENMVCNYNHWYNARGGEQDLACIEGLRWAIHWGLSKVILESDCAWVAARISNPQCGGQICLVS